MHARRVAFDQMSWRGAMARRACCNPIAAESIFGMRPLIDPLDIWRGPPTGHLTTDVSTLPGDPGSAAGWLGPPHARTSWSARSLAFTPIGSRGHHQNMILYSLHECESRMAQPANQSN